MSKMAFFLENMYVSIPNLNSHVQSQNCTTRQPFFAFVVAHVYNTFVQVPLPMGCCKGKMLGKIR